MGRRGGIDLIRMHILLIIVDFYIFNILQHLCIHVSSRLIIVFLNLQSHFRMLRCFAFNMFHKLTVLVFICR